MMVVRSSQVSMPVQGRLGPTYLIKLEIFSLVSQGSAPQLVPEGTILPPVKQGLVGKQDIYVSFMGCT
jgi:hypothetical protein